MSCTPDKLRKGITAFAISSLLVLAGPANAADLKVLSPHAMRPALNDLVPEFERSSGHRVIVYYATTSSLVKDIEAGKTADVAILPPEQIEQLQDDDKI